jgi:hypothetical protein
MPAPPVAASYAFVPLSASRGRRRYWFDPPLGIVPYLLEIRQWQNAYPAHGPGPPDERRVRS